MVHEMFKFLDKPLFKRPRWLRPELDRPIYYVHIAIILGVVYGLMQWQNPAEVCPNEIMMFIRYGVYLIIGDGIAHTVLGMD